MRVVMMTLAMLLCAPLHAQDQPDNGYEVQLSVTAFGVGGLAREGEWTGIQVQMQDLGSSSRDIVLRMEIPDEDGDLTQYDRVVTANPVVLQSFWLYAWLPYRSAGSEFELKAFEAVDEGGAGDGANIGFRAGRLVGQFTIYNPQMQVSTIALAGIVGSNQVGLDQYGYSVGNQPWMPFGHELLRTSAGLGVDNLPDRWQGLSAFDTLVWSTATTASYDPARLTPEKARAIREWVSRGGHLVIVMQSSGDPWYLGSHPLRSVLPSVQIPNRNEGVSLEPYRTMLTEMPNAELPGNAVVYSFTPLDDAGEEEAMPVLQGPSGDTVVTRRLLGSGMVTVIGLPLNDGQLRRVGLPEPEAFWHRVLGLRGDVLRPDQMTDQQKSDAGTREQLSFDQGVGDSISKTGTAIQGVLFGIVVFIVYWLLAGPLGYMVLKQRKQTRHAWMGFVACIAAFTAIAWLGATTLRPKKATVSHFTMLQQVHGQETQRARSWLSAMLPSYGEATISVDDPGSETAFGSQESSNLLIPWKSPDAGPVIGGGFPDNSGYRVQSRAPSVLTVPTRATVKSFYSDWSGQSSWRMPYVVGDVGAIEEPKLTLEGQVVSGQIAHGLPGTLKDIRVFVISRMAPLNRPGQLQGRRAISRAMVYAPSIGEDGWLPDTAIELRDVTSIEGGNTRAMLDNYFESSVRFGVSNSGLGTNRGTLTDRIVAGMFISQFEPPRYGASNADLVGERLATRRLLHGWDMGRWFTQPTLIITGVLDIDSDDASPDAMPNPVWIDGRQVPSSGTTVVTWVYPFEPAPPEHLAFQGGAPAGAQGESDSNDAPDTEN